jgi:hypothetical protein
MTDEREQKKNGVGKPVGQVFQSVLIIEWTPRQIGKPAPRRRLG